MRVFVQTWWTSLLRRSKLSTLMVTCFICLNLLVLLAVTWLSYQAFSRATFNEISKARLALLNESTRRGFDFMTNMTSTAYSVVSNKDITDWMSGSLEKSDIVNARRKITELLQRTLVTNEGIGSIEIYSDLFNAVPKSATDLVYPIDRIAAEPWFPSLKKADAVWISADPNEASKPLIGYAQHMFNSKGQTNGYVVIRMNQDDVLRHFADVPMVLEGQVYMVDGAGKAILQFDDPTLKDSRPIMDESLLAAVSAHTDDGYELYPKRGRSYLVLFSKPSPLQWRMVQVIPAGKLLASTRQAGWHVLAVGALGLFLSAILAYLFVKNIVKPLRRLMMEMKRLERGDFNTKSTSSFTEEYAQLSFSFNHMVGRLKELMESVQKESKAKREAQKSLLEAQIKPHFLYNTLDMIHWRALDYQAPDISHMITQLGKMLRIGLSSGKMFIRIRDELEHARCYIDIQTARLPFPIDYNEEVERHVRGYYIPKIILQPFIENAVMHGRTEHTDEPLRIGLKIAERRTDGMGPFIEILLTDSGKGLPEGWELERTTGIGIRNVQMRIGLYCGTSYGLVIANRSEGGVAVTIRLPVIETEQQLQRWLDGEFA